MNLVCHEKVREGEDAHDDHARAALTKVASAQHVVFVRQSSELGVKRTVRCKRCSTPPSLIAELPIADFS